MATVISLICTAKGTHSPIVLGRLEKDLTTGKLQVPAEYKMVRNRRVIRPSLWWVNSTMSAEYDEDVARRVAGDGESPYELFRAILREQRADFRPNDQQRLDTWRQSELDTWRLEIACRRRAIAPDGISLLRPRPGDCPVEMAIGEEKLRQLYDGLVELGEHKFDVSSW